VTGSFYQIITARKLSGDAASSASSLQRYGGCKEDARGDFFFFKNASMPSALEAIFACKIHHAKAKRWRFYQAMWF
jgi:hypothetical protein